MTVTRIRPMAPAVRPEFGVRYSAALDRVTYVDECANEEAARRWLHALQFCGNTDAALVRWDGTAWVAVTQ